MKMLKQFSPRLMALAVAFITVMSLIVYASIAPSTNPMLSAASIGSPEGSELRMLVNSNGSDRVQRIIYFKSENHVTGGANTPVASGTVCNLAGTLHFAEVKFTGTMAGTAPTLAIKWQNSKDGGTTWSDVGTWTTINATVTPASQTQQVGDLVSMPFFNGTTTVNSTTTAYGDCWRVTYTMTGTGAAGVFSVTGFEK